MVKVPCSLIRNLVKEVISFGGDGIKKCYQCGTCTAACPNSEHIATSFRKLIKYVQLGLESKILHMPVMWFCAECTDCINKCPRNANPHAVLSALQKYSVAKCSPSYRFTKALITSPWPTVLLTLILIASISIIGILEGRITPEVVKAGLHTLIPESYYYPTVMLMIFFFLCSTLYSAYRFTSYIREGSVVPSPSTTTPFLVLLKDFLVQKWLHNCRKEKNRWIAHLMTFWGFIGAMTASFLRFLLGIKTPPPFPHPVKMLGNVSGTLLLLGLTLLLIRRISRKDISSSNYDYSFLFLLYIATWSGFITQFARMANMYLIACGSYVIHAATAAVVLLFAPYTKFAHVLYMPLAIWLGSRKGLVK